MSKKKERFVCSASERYWLEQQLIQTRQSLQRSMFMTPPPPAGIPVPENRQESTQAYVILINFFQKAIKAFDVAPGEVTVPLHISNGFVQALKALDREGLINIDLVPKAS